MTDERRLPTLPQKTIDALNPGIRRTVQWLWSNGFQTCDSGDGETHEFECDFPRPNVVMLVEPDELISEGRRLYALLQSVGIHAMPLSGLDGDTTPYIEGHWSPCDNMAMLSLYEVTDSMLRDVSGDE